MSYFIWLTICANLRLNVIKSVLVFCALDPPLFLSKFLHFFLTVLFSTTKFVQPVFNSTFFKKKFSLGRTQALLSLFCFLLFLKIKVQKQFRKSQRCPKCARGSGTFCNNRAAAHSVHSGSHTHSGPLGAAATWPAALCWEAWRHLMPQQPGAPPATLDSWRKPPPTPESHPGGSRRRHRTGHC